MFDIERHKYLSYTEFIATVKELGLETVEIIASDLSLEGKTLDDLLEMSKGTYKNGTPREGIVIRPMIEEYVPKLGRFSFKVINPDFLIKYGLWKKKPGT